jgi:hypothetical protein
MAKARRQSISGATILTKLKAVMMRELHATDIRVSHLLTRYFDTIPLDVIGFGPTLNDSPEFAPDNLGLLPKHLRHLGPTDKVGALQDAIKKKYRANGWTVT